MNKEALEKKIAELLNVAADEKSLAFSLLKEKLAGHLKIDEAIKIPQLGVFQLKEKLGKSEAAQSTESEPKDLTLVFSPETSDGIEDSLFINLELDSQLKDDTQFDEGVFQLGIDKPLATSNEADTPSSSLTELEDSISNLLENSEKLENFDLWDDYLKAKESTSILEDESDVEPDILSDQGDSETDRLVVEPIDETEFVPVEENEEFDDLIDENEFIQDDELTSLTDEIEINETPVDDILDSSMEEEVDLQEVQDKLEAADEKITEDETESTVLDEIDLELKDEKPVEDEFDEIIKEQIENIKGGEVEEDESQIVKEVKSMHSSLIPPEDKEVKYRISSKSRNPVIYSLIAMFIIVGAIGIYYLFFRNPTWLYDEYEHEVTLSEKHLQEYRAKKNELLKDDSLKTESNKNSNLENEQLEKSKNETDEQLASLDDKKNEVSLNETPKPSDGSDKSITKSDKIVQTEKPKEDSKKKITNQKNVKQPVTKSTVNNTGTYKEREIVQNIYYDGYVYNVQLSSWQKRNIAESEVARYIKKGFPAFLVKAYISKYKSHWYRVRIGPYNTLDEAKIDQKKIK